MALDLNIKRVAGTVGSALVHSAIIVGVFLLALPSLQVHDAGGNIGMDDLHECTQQLANFHLPTFPTTPTVQIFRILTC
jgi:hypothetical protein